MTQERVPAGQPGGGQFGRSIHEAADVDSLEGEYFDDGGVFDDTNMTTFEMIRRGVHVRLHCTVPEPENEQIPDGDEIPYGVRMDISAVVDLDTTLFAPMSIGPDTTIEHGCIVGPNTTIGANVHLGQGVVVYPDVVVGDKTKVNSRAAIKAGAIIERKCRIGYGAIIGPDCVIGAESYIEDYAEVPANTTLPPGTIFTAE